MVVPKLGVETKVTWLFLSWGGGQSYLLVPKLGLVFGQSYTCRSFEIHSDRDRVSARTFLFDGMGLALYTSSLIQAECQFGQRFSLQAKVLGTSLALLVDVRYHGRIVREHQSFDHLRIMAE